METRCLETLSWFITKSEKDKWELIYDKNLNLNIYGVIDSADYGTGYKFMPVLNKGLNVYKVNTK